VFEISQTEVYARWFDSLRDRKARARIDVRIRRLSLGNPGDVSSVGEGVSELRIDYGFGLPRLFRAARSNTDHPAYGRRQTHSGSGYLKSIKDGTRILGGCHGKNEN
jgi:putative addiction module killer protein